MSERQGMEQNKPERQRTDDAARGAAPAHYVPLRHRKETYLEELDRLRDTYSAALVADVEELSTALTVADGENVWFVGNGGTLAVARIAAELHGRVTGRTAHAATSMAFAAAGTGRDGVVVVLSSGARHPDTASAVQAAFEMEAREVTLVTQRSAQDLSGVLASPRLRVVTLPTSGPDGFLATNSVLSMATALARAYGVKLPSMLPSLKVGAPNTDIRPDSSLIVLSGPSTLGPSTDLETRLVETGLANVQVTDFRNFAHGRHFGLSRHLDRTTVVSFADARLQRLAEATLSVLPDEVSVTRVESNAPDSVAGLDLLVSSMKLFGEIASRADFDPARPSVPQFGRQLYHLNSRRLLGNEEVHPALVRKAQAGGRNFRDAAVRKKLQASFEEWRSALNSQRFRAVALDYDGTVCETDRRFDLPDATIRESILGLLSMGFHVGFATGRGQSIIKDLQRWMPEDSQGRVLVGLYNGAIRGTLGQLSDEEHLLHMVNLVDDFAQSGSLLPDLTRLAKDGGWSIARRPTQLTMEPISSNPVPPNQMKLRVEELVARIDPKAEHRFKAFRSAHSIDVTAVSTSKSSVAIELQRWTEAEVLTIGDQGQLGGNDFELLSLTRSSLSVDRVSADLTRCWRLDSPALRGPSLTGKYLRSLKRTRSGDLRFAWRTA